MTLVDTTVWIDFFRGSPTDEKRALDILLQKAELVCLTDIILTEILRGIASEGEYGMVKNHLASLPCLTARVPRTFFFAADLYRHCRKKGATVRSTVDCLIAAVCIENKVPLLHHDADFHPLAKWCGLKVLDPAAVFKR